MVKIGIIGAGFVGSTTAYTLALKGLAQEIVLIDLNEIKAEAEALDILHAAAMNKTCRISFGNYEDLNGADIVIITVDSQKTLDGDRMALLQSNAQIMKNIIPQIAKNAPQTILLIATNPVDVITKLAADLSGFPSRRVIGSGTVLDTARFQAILAEKFNIDPQSVQAYVIGEHGSSSVVSWATARIGGTSVDNFAAASGIDLGNKEEISRDVIDAGFKIYRGKKATYYGIASSLAQICQAIIKNENRCLCVSSQHADIDGVKNVCLSLPTIVGSQGAGLALIPDLSDTERKKLKESAEKMADAAATI